MNVNCFFRILNNEELEKKENLKSKGEEGVKKGMDTEHPTKVRGNGVKCRSGINGYAFERRGRMMRLRYGYVYRVAYYAFSNMVLSSSIHCVQTSLK